MNRVKAALILLSLSLIIPCASCAQTPQHHPVPKHDTGLNKAQISNIAQDAIRTFDTPGMAVAIVKDGKVIFKDGFGVRDITNHNRVDENTLFRIASTTKAFTATALAVLVDDGQLNWDDKVIKYLPGFRMHDAWVTNEFTIRDLLTHRSGLGLGAGDLMLWPEPSGFTRTELIHNLRYFKPVSSFRSQYAYDNLLYIVAGEVVAKVAETRWENFVQSRILDPLDMDCYAGEVPKPKRRQTAIPYAFIDQKIVEVTRNRIENTSNISAAAGGLVCNADGMSTWMLTQLSGGIGPNGVRVVSKTQHNEMWKGQTILTVSQTEREIDNTHFKTYALGWRKEDMHGYEVISHTGTLSGYQAYIVLVPELALGVALLNNGSNSGARTAFMQSMIKHYMEQPKVDWVQHYAEAQAKRRENQKAKPETANDNSQGSGTVNRPVSTYAGTYKDNWFGKVDIVQVGSALRFQSRKMIKMVGSLEAFNDDTFIIRWDDPEFRADAYMQFNTDKAGTITGASLRHVDSDGDWSFNFQDLSFIKVTN